MATKGVTRVRELYERPRPVVDNPVGNRWFAQLGRCLGFEARPAVLHFGGYQVGATHTQILKVLNISEHAKRLVVVNPTTAEFKVRVEKCGVLAPGMVETLAIDFEPKEWKYHYDCIRIYTEADNLLVPIHAYPVMNQVKFPRRIDFGNCHLGETRTRIVRLSCAVPIQFDFSLSIQKDHPDFKVAPVRGIVPANGSAEVLIDFTPLNFGTCIMELLVFVSQFNFEPILCTVTGGSIPGMVRDRAINEAASNLIDSQGGGMTLGTQSTLSPQTFGAKGVLTALQQKTTTVASTQELPHQAASILIDSHLEPRVSFRANGAGSGAAFDGGAEWMSDKVAKASAWRRLQAEHEVTNPGGVTNYNASVEVDTATTGVASRPDTDDGLSEALVEGLRIPQEIKGIAAVNYILTQQPGKLKPKALQAAIRTQRAIRAEQLAEQEEIRIATGRGVGGGDLSSHAIKAEESVLLAQRKKETTGKPAGQSRQLRELVFLQDLADIGRDESEREFKSSREALGGTPLTPEESDVIATQRRRVERKLSILLRTDDRALPMTRRRGPYDKPSDCGRAETLAETNPRYFGPSFDPYANNTWSKRRATLQQLIYLVGKWVVRRRSARRIVAIQARLGDCTTREAVRTLVELDNQQAAATGSKIQQVGRELKLGAGPLTRGPALSPLRFKISNGALQSMLFPAFEEAESTTRMSVSGEDLSGDLAFQDLAFFSLRKPREASLMSYIKMVPPYVDSYIPPRPFLGGMRSGALEELSVRAPRGQDARWVLDDARELHKAETRAQNLVDCMEGADGASLPSQPVPNADRVDAIFDTLFVMQGHVSVEETHFGVGGRAVTQSLEDGGIKNLKEGTAGRRKAHSGVDPCGIFCPAAADESSDAARAVCGISVKLLRPSPNVKAFTSTAESLPQETDDEWPLRPQPITYDVPHNYGSRLANSIGSSSLHSYGNVPTLSHDWRPRRQRRSSALACLSSQHNQLIWQHQDLPVRRSGAADDVMSDSESDDEGDGGVVIPMVALARGFFDPNRDRSTLSNISDQVSDIMRDRKMGMLEMKLIETKRTNARQLPQMLRPIGENMANLRGSFILQG